MKEVTCIVSRESWALTRGKKYPILEEDEAERRVRVCGDDGCVRWSPMYCFDMTGDSRSLQPYTLWIEAEEWAPGEWNPADDNSDAIVTFADGTRWVASFFSYANIASLTAKNRITGECLSGRYFWSSDMLLVDEVSRRRIEEVIADLIAEGRFEWVFSRCADSNDEEETA